ncbi:shikimate kinase [Thalassobacillus hwangdonensis]|uniref:Shikimate kinase n=1 Tax=Thalassobacillus hwangdonensis TaxID=546108 RepID=A0ABW3L2C2_9BACI
METIFLIGYMGSGKSTVANILSRKLNLPKIEMDEEIIKKSGKSIPEIFAQWGEEKFRSIETEVLENIPPKGYVVSTGGGVPLRAENQRLMDKGVVVFLNAAWQTIAERLEHDKSRPLWQTDVEENKKRFMDRLNIYTSCADITVDVDGYSPEEIADQIITECL